MAKYKSTITGIGDAKERLQRFVNSVKNDPAVLQEMADLARDQIIKRTQGRIEEYKQPELKKSTVDRRKKLIAIGNKGLYAQASRSNLTLSDQLLQSITYHLTVSTGVIRFFLKPFREKYIGLKGVELETKTNPEIKQDLEKIGRRFFFISKSLTANLENRIKQIFRRRLANYKKLSKTLK
jgi:hypothetical protein